MHHHYSIILTSNYSNCYWWKFNSKSLTRDRHLLLGDVAFSIAGVCIYMYPKFRCHEIGNCEIAFSRSQQFHIRNDFRRKCTHRRRRHRHGCRFAVAWRFKHVTFVNLFLFYPLRSDRLVDEYGIWNVILWAKHTNEYRLLEDLSGRKWSTVT